MTAPLKPLIDKKQDGQEFTRSARPSPKIAPITPMGLGPAPRMGQPEKPGGGLPPGVERIGGTMMNAGGGAPPQFAPSGPPMPTPGAPPPQFAPSGPPVPTMPTAPPPHRPPHGRRPA